MIMANCCPELIQMINVTCCVTEKCKVKTKVPMVKQMHIQDKWNKTGRISLHQCVLQVSLQFSLHCWQRIDQWIEIYQKIVDHNY